MKTLFTIFIFFLATNSFAEFKIISRADWSALPAQTARMKTVEPQGYNALTLYFPTEADFRNCGSATIQNYQKKMMTETNLPDVPFQFLIDRCGNIYQGQELNTLPQHAGSTHEYIKQQTLTLNPNFQNMGVALLSHSSSDITVPQQAATVWLIDHLRGQYSLQSLMQIEELQRSVQLCGYHYVANGYLKTTNSAEQNEASRKILNFFKSVLPVGRHNSLCARTY